MQKDDIQYESSSPTEDDPGFISAITNESCVEQVLLLRASMMGWSIWKLSSSILFISELYNSVFHPDVRRIYLDFFSFYFELFTNFLWDTCEAVKVCNLPIKICMFPLVYICISIEKCVSLDLS